MSYHDVKVLVTGADGFIGSHLVHALVERGARVTALALYNSFDTFGWLDDLPDAVRDSIDLMRGDVRDAAFVARIVPGHRIVFHLAAMISIPQSYATPQAYVDTNVTGTLNVLEAARRAGTERVVHTSTSEVYGTAITVPIREDHPLQGQSPYSASKIGADMMAAAFARSFSTPVTILRPFNTFGPRQSERAIVPTLIRQALDPACPAIAVGDTSTTRDLTFVADTVAAFLAAGTAPELEFGHAYNAGSGRGISVADLIQVVCDLCECSKPVVQDSVRMRPANSEVRNLLADSTLFRKSTGWRPETALRDGLALTIDWWRHRLAAGWVRRQKDFVA